MPPEQEDPKGGSSMVPAAAHELKTISSGLDDVLALTHAIKEAMEPQIQAQVQIAQIEATKERFQIEQETRLIADEQRHRHSRFKHWYWGILTLCVCFFGLSVGLFFTGREEAGALLLSHFFATAAGAFGGRSFGKNKSAESSEE